MTGAQLTFEEYVRVLIHHGVDFFDWFMHGSYREIAADPHLTVESCPFTDGYGLAVFCVYFGLPEAEFCVYAKRGYEENVLNSPDATSFRKYVSEEAALPGSRRNKMLALVEERRLARVRLRAGMQG